MSGINLKSLVVFETLSTLIVVMVIAIGIGYEMNTEKDTGLFIIMAGPIIALLTTFIAYLMLKHKLSNI